MTPATTVEQALEHEGPASELRLAIADARLGAVGVNMAIVTDGLLTKGFMPDGFEEHDGFRVYKYTEL